MNIHDAPEQLSAYLDGELSASEHAQVEAHLPTCAECRATIDALRASIADLGRLQAPVPSDQDSWALRSALAAARKNQSQRWRIGAAAAGVAAIVIGFVAFGPIGTTTPTSDDVAFGAALSDMSGAPTFTLIDGDLDEEGARALLAPGPEAMAAPAAPNSMEERTIAGEPAAADSAPQGKSLQSRDWSAAISTCEASILEGNDGYRAERYLIGTYQGERAMFMIYAVEERLEVWVVAPDDCSTLYWAQRSR